MTSTQAHVYPKLVALLLDKGCRVEAIKPSNGLDSYLPDSLDRIEFSFLVENCFEIPISNAEYSTLDVAPLAEWVVFVDRKLKEEQADALSRSSLTHRRWRCKHCRNSARNN